MNLNLGLKVLSQIMDWDDDKARSEFKWLRFMSQYKYDDYREYLAGVRFIESLATWLQQFDQDDRKLAYQYLKDDLIYISTSELQRLVGNFYSQYVQKHLVQSAASSIGIKKYLIWSEKKNIQEFEWQARKTLFMGLSDGARIDTFRRQNNESISNEQVVATTQIDVAKWKSLIEKLITGLNSIRPGKGNLERFNKIYLVDDFTASGTSLLRYDKAKTKYKGKLVKFYESLETATKELEDEYGELLDADWELIVHHYIGSEMVAQHVENIYAAALKHPDHEKWNSNRKFTFGMRLQASACLQTDHPFAALCEKYYDASIETSHAEESGNPDMRYGYGQCALPLVLEHNTPNNSLPLLWAETKGKKGKHAMQPLFRRRQRHT